MFFRKMNKELWHLRVEIDEYRKELDRYKKYYDSEIFKIRYPMGIVDNQYNPFCFVTSDYDSKNVIYRKSFRNEVIEIKIAKINSELEEYKIAINDGNTYIGLKYDNQEDYYIIDCDNKSVVKIDLNELKIVSDVEWVKNK